MRWTELAAMPTGTAFVDLATVDAVGPAISETLAGVTRVGRVLYLRGGQCIAIMETPANLELLGLHDFEALQRMVRQ